MESQDQSGASGTRRFRRQLTLLWSAIAILTLALAAAVAWIATAAAPAVLTAERLEIVEPDGSPAMVLANSQRPAAATIDGEVLMEGQEEERRGVPSIIFFDGKGDEVGGMLFGVRETPGGYRAMRHFSLDAHEQDQTVVLMHYQSPNGSESGLRVSDRPVHSISEALAQLGLSVGASREQLQAAVGALPEAGREARLRELFGGTPRAFLGSTTAGEATLTLRDGEGRPRIVIEAPGDGDPAIRILDEEGATVLRLPEP